MQLASSLPLPQLPWTEATNSSQEKKNRAQRQPSEKRLRLISKRQANQTWGDDYIPAICAVRGEAPSISHATTIISKKIHGREIHLLSSAEVSAALLGLYHPDVIGLQEQRAFSSGEAPHPLHNLKSGIPIGTKPLKGIIDVSERLDYLEQLPTIKVQDSTGASRSVIFPFIGDLLWAMRSKNGHHYCLNWSVKDSEDAFKRPLEGKRYTIPNGQITEKVLMRHEIENCYYQDAGIRTVFLASESIDKNVVANLRQLFLHHARKISISQEEQDEITERFRMCIASETPAYELIAKLIGAGKYSLDDCRNILYQAIWFRRLKVNLFEPIIINRPLKPEENDILEVYADWFKELPSC